MVSSSLSPSSILPLSKTHVPATTLSTTFFYFLFSVHLSFFAGKAGALENRIAASLLSMYFSCQNIGGVGIFFYDSIS